VQNFTLDFQDSVALVTFDMPGKSVNVISKAVLDDLELLTARIKEDAQIKGVILCSGKERSFCAGADLAEMLGDIARWRQARSQDELGAGVAQAGAYSQKLRALETCGKPIVAVVHGTTLGGGLELALACHHRVAIDDDMLSMALPEASIGLMPGAGATQRLIRTLGVVGAIPYLLDGEPLSAEVALEGGVLHASARTRDDAMEKARSWIAQSGAHAAPWDVRGFKLPSGGPHTPAAYQVFGPAIAARLSGAARAPGTGNILKSIYEGAQVPIDAALRIETRYFFNTARSAEAQVAIEAFFARKAKKTTAAV
jgi:3-hydroxyacyl-CoA dehydrogenase/enoyl-CoA hydratase/3-hydroxybutyryl-CoA epimerase